MFGAWQTVYRYFRMWDSEGAIDRAFAALRGHMTDEVWSIDGTLIRAHRSAAGAGHAGGPDEPSDHALGRSRRGFGTKAHLLVDVTGLPLHVHLTGGQVHEAKAFDQITDDLEVLMNTVRPMFVAGDKAYGSKRIRGWLIERNVTPVIPTGSDLSVPENEIAREIVDAAFKVHTTLGPGLLESVYQAVLAHELETRDLRVRREVPIASTFRPLCSRRYSICDQEP